MAYLMKYQLMKICYSFVVIEIICLSLEEGGKKMRCPKCKGRMHAEKCYDFVRSFDAWKCCLCGELIDPIILSNRARTQNLFMG